MPYTLQNINQWYQSVQFRDGNPATAGSYVILLNEGALTQDQVWQAILDDRFTTDYVNPVIRLYQAAFGRIPDQAGQNFWVDDYAASKITRLDIAKEFANSKEFKDTFGSSSADQPISAAILTKLYQNVLQREPDAAGYGYWLNSGLNVAQVLDYFTNSTEFILSTDTVIESYQRSQLNHTLPTQKVSLWSFSPPPTPEPDPEEEADPGPEPDPTTFTVTDSGGSLVFGGTATGDVTFTVAPDGTATFSRGGVTASSTSAVSSIAASPLSLKLSADVSSISLADAFAMVNIYNYDANGHVYTLSDTSGSLGAITVAQADVVEDATNAASYTYTVADSIAHANSLNFTTGYAGNLGIDLTGSSGDQSVTGSIYADSIHGGDGYDLIDGGAGNDTLTGGDENDTMTGGTGVDTFNSDHGTDTIIDLEPGETLNVSLGVDTYVSLLDLTTANVNNSGTITITGTINAESIIGSSGVDIIFGDNGNDTITGGAGPDQIWVGSGIDTVAFNAVAGSTSDSNVGVGWDILQDIKLSDFIRINASNVNQFSVTSNVTAYGTDYYADINVNGYTTGDVYIRIYGDMFASFGSDYAAMQINAIAHTIVDLSGTNLADTLGGGSNNDTITGGQGIDSLSGQAGSDIFRFMSGDTGITLATADVIQDFTTGEDTLSVWFVFSGYAEVDGAALNEAAFLAAADAAFDGSTLDAYVAYDANNSGNAWAVFDLNANGSVDMGDTFLVLVGVNQASEITDSDITGLLV